MPNRQSYNEAHFIGRQDSIAAVLGKAATLSNGADCAGQRRIVVFQGERGVGKSWLLRHLYTLLTRQPQYRVSLIDLAPYARLHADIAMGQICKQVAGDILDGAVSTLHRALETANWGPAFPPAPQLRIILIDSVGDVGDDLKTRLRSWLDKMLRMPQVLMVLALNAGQPHSDAWILPHGIYRTDRYKLSLFRFSETQQQIKPFITARHKRLHGMQVHYYSTGHPLINYALAREHNLPKALDKAIRYLLVNTQTHEDYAELRAHLEALAVLNFAEREHVPTMFTAYYNDFSLRDNSPEDYQGVFMRFLARNVATWDIKNGQQGYFIHSYLKHLLEAYLKHHQHRLWRRLHYAAIQIYEEWSSDHALQRNYWRRQCLYHWQQLEFDWRDWCHYG